MDDDETIRTLGTAILNTQGYEVLSASDGFGGLSALKSALPDIIISDLQMPNMNGFEFLSVVRKRFPQIPVIVMSGEFVGRNVPESVLADAFFPKGQYSTTEFFAEILSLLNEFPLRPLEKWQPKAAVWIPVAPGFNYIAVTCTHCLRTFPVPVPHSQGEHTELCDFCCTEVTFQISEDL